MRATFVLPGGAGVPTGGSKMVFRYANALAEQGWEIGVVMPPGLKPVWAGRRAMRLARYWLERFSGSYSPASWLNLDSRVRLHWMPDLAPMRAPVSDLVIATAVQTAEMVAQWPAAAGRKIYFIQGYETWDFPVSRVEASWRLPFRKIAISRWLVELIAAAGERAVYVPNGLDHAAFGMDVPNEDRERVLVWPHHAAPQKGSPDVLAALVEVLRDDPRWEIHAFGLARRPRAAGLRVHYHQNPASIELRRLLNRAAIAVAPSHSEGWGLPACEALQCGCALIATDNGGHREFLRPEENALAYPPGEHAKLVTQLRRLMRDSSLRVKLAKQGPVDMERFRFDQAADQFRRALEATDECG